MPQYLNQEDFIKAIALYNAREFYKKAIEDMIEGDKEIIELSAKLLAYITVFLQKKKKIIYFPEIVDNFFNKREKFYQVPAATDLEFVCMLQKTRIMVIVKGFFDKVFYSCKPYDLPHFYQEAKESLKNKDK